MTRPAAMLVVRLGAMSGALPVAMAAALTAAAFSACAGPLPELDPVGDAAAATGTTEAIVFRDDAESIDAAPPPAVGELTVAAAVRAALQHDPHLQEALAVARGALAAASQARRWPNPILDVIFRFPEGGGKTMVDAGLWLDVVALLQTPTRASAADHRLRAACASAVAAALDVLADVQDSYARLQALDGEAPVLEARVRAAQQLAALGRARLEAGESTRIDLAELEALKLGLELEAVERGRERATERLRLLRLVGAPSGGARSGGPTFSLEEWAAPESLGATEAQLLAVALQRRPELAAAKAEVLALGDDLDLAGLAWLTGAKLGAAAEREGTWSVGPVVAVPVPLFDGGGPRQQLVAAEWLAARHRATALGRRIVEAVRGAFTAAAAAEVRLTRVRDELLPLARQRRSLAEAAYRLGEADVGAMLRAEQELRAAEGSLLLLQRDLWVARIALERAVGGPTALALALAMQTMPMPEEQEQQQQGSGAASDRHEPRAAAGTGAREERAP